ncbi:TonB-dependent receptor [Anatilimnocola floriformis]|uniref:TonB-dependent receptor n=1 Tax=Anatilimnocola floriformis TaxID=2948575 RepID=UPI0020C3FFB8|nr:TonB-dependent siderophore receptor [Anatilimnocola floriformis]
MIVPKMKRPNLRKLRAWIGAGLACGVLAWSGTARGDELSQPPAPEPTAVAVNNDTSDFVLFDDPFANTSYDSPFASLPVQGYAAPSTTTPTRFDLPILQFPGVVNTVTQDLIWDRSSITFDQALQTVPNVVPRNGTGGRSDEYNIRGFNVGFAGSDFRKDGFRDSSWVRREVQNIERIEVLKGPASALYGSASQPAGVINVITKKAINARFADVDFMVGSDNLFRTVGDLNTPLLGNENVLGRLNYAVQDSGSFRDFVNVDRQFIAPSLTFVLDDQTTLTFQGEYLHDTRPTDRGLVFLPNTPVGNPLALPINTFLGQPTDGNEYNDGQFNLFLNHWVNDNWFWRMGYVSNWSGEHRSNYDTRGVVGNNVTRQYVQQQSIAQDHYAIADITGEVDGPLFKHRVLVGTELGTTVNDVSSRNSVVTGFPLNVNDPYNTPGANYSLYPAVPALAAPLTSGSEVDQYGVYFQDLIELTSTVKALVGVRGNAYDSKNFSNGNRTDQSWQILTPRYGLVYEPLPEQLSFYAAYSETFNPVQGNDINGDPLVPESGFGFDVGTKMQVIDQLWLTVGYFDIERTNVVQAIPLSVPPASTQIGLVRSTGFEVELFGQITERWSIINGYGMTDARIENDRVAANIGKQLTNTPNWQGSLWTRYNFIQESNRVVGAGFGMLYTDSWFISADNNYSLPGYTRFDMALYYDVGRWRSMLFIENLTDQRYAVSGNNSTSITPGAPITLRGTVGVSF